MIRTLLTFLALLSVAALAFLAGMKFATSGTDASHDNATRSLILLLIALGGFLLCYLNLATTQDAKDDLQAAVARSAGNPELIAELAQVRQEILRLGSSQNLLSTTTAQPGDLNGAVAALAKDLGIREKETQRLHEVLTRRDHRNALARLATIREAAEFTRKINDAGKIADKEALNQVIMEIEAALDDLGLEIMHVSAGTRIADLPNGSFSILSATQPEAGELPGTVKEAVTEAVFLRDADGKQVFIAPAKLRAYKL